MMGFLLFLIRRLFCSHRWARDMDFLPTAGVSGLKCEKCDRRVAVHIS